MSQFQYSDTEKDLNKVLKMNQDLSDAIAGDPELALQRKRADASIEASQMLLRSLGKAKEIDALSQCSQKQCKKFSLEHKPQAESWEEIACQAQVHCPELVSLEDIMSAGEIKEAFQERDAIEREFSKQTGLINKTDLSFLAVATALQTAKALLFPYVAGKAGYGTSFDPNDRLPHDDSSIESRYQKANDSFRDKKLNQGAKTGYWINILYQTPPYDIVRGSPTAGLSLHGGAHRLYTLGHDPILGWLFGTMNILTDTITTNRFQSRLVQRNPMKILPGNIPIDMILQESCNVIQADRLNLPAAIFAQAQHLKSDEYTKAGLPVPVLAAINEQFASKLYQEHYDALCFSRDVKIIGASFAISAVIDMILGLTHGLFREKTVSKDLHEVRTRKILLISNLLASGSTVVNASITSNPRNLDIGSLLNTLSHLFLDVRFISRIRQEYIEERIQEKLRAEFEEIDRLYQQI